MITYTILYKQIGGFLATPQYEQIEYFEKPWVPEDAVDKLYEEWVSFKKETDSWDQWDWKSSCKKFRNNKTI